MNAVEDLLYEDFAIRTIMNPTKGPDGMIEGIQVGLKPLCKIAITRSHAGASLTTEEIQSLIARITCLVTPKLLCRLWL